VAKNGTLSRTRSRHSSLISIMANKAILRRPNNLSNDRAQRDIKRLANTGSLRSINYKLK
jgi:hypothetical protein